jgi:hypothetical protein
MSYPTTRWTLSRLHLSKATPNYLDSNPSDTMGLFDLGTDSSPWAQDERLIEGYPSHRLFILMTERSNLRFYIFCGLRHQISGCLSVIIKNWRENLMAQGLTIGQLEMP